MDIFQGNNVYNLVDVNVKYIVFIKYRVYETGSIVSSDLETTSFQSETTGRHTALSEFSSVSRLHVAGRKRPQRRRKQRQVKYIINQIN